VTVSPTETPIAIHSRINTLFNSVSGQDAITEESDLTAAASSSATDEYEAFATLTFAIRNEIRTIERAIATHYTYHPIDKTSLEHYLLALRSVYSLAMQKVEDEALAMQAAAAIPQQRQEEEDEAAASTVALAPYTIALIQASYKDIDQRHSIVSKTFVVVTPKDFVDALRTSALNLANPNNIAAFFDNLSQYTRLKYDIDTHITTYSDTHLARALDAILPLTTLVDALSRLHQATSSLPPTFQNNMRQQLIDAMRVALPDSAENVTPETYAAAIFTIQTQLYDIRDIDAGRQENRFHLPPTALQDWEHAVSDFIAATAKPFAHSEPHLMLSQSEPQRDSESDVEETQDQAAATRHTFAEALIQTSYQTMLARHPAPQTPMQEGSSNAGSSSSRLTAEALRYRLQALGSACLRTDLTDVSAFKSALTSYVDFKNAIDQHIDTYGDTELKQALYPAIPLIHLLDALATSPNRMLYENVTRTALTHALQAALPVGAESVPPQSYAQALFILQQSIHHVSDILVGRCDNDTSLSRRELQTCQTALNAFVTTAVTKAVTAEHQVITIAKSLQQQSTRTRRLTLDEDSQPMSKGIANALAYESIKDSLNQLMVRSQAIACQGALYDTTISLQTYLQAQEMSGYIASSYASGTLSEQLYVMVRAIGLACIDLSLTPEQRQMALTTLHYAKGLLQTHHQHFKDALLQQGRYNLSAFLNAVGMAYNLQTQQFTVNDPVRRLHSSSRLPKDAPRIFEDLITETVQTELGYAGHHSDQATSLRHSLNTTFKNIESRIWPMPSSANASLQRRLFAVFAEQCEQKLNKYLSAKNAIVTKKPELQRRLLDIAGLLYQARELKYACTTGGNIETLANQYKMLILALDYLKQSLGLLNPSATLAGHLSLLLEQHLALSGRIDRLRQSLPINAKYPAAPDQQNTTVRGKIYISEPEKDGYRSLREYIQFTEAKDERVSDREPRFFEMRSSIPATDYSRTKQHLIQLGLGLAGLAPLPTQHSVEVPNHPNVLTSSSSTPAAATVPVTRDRFNDSEFIPTNPIDTRIAQLETSRGEFHENQRPMIITLVDTAKRAMSYHPHRDFVQPAIKHIVTAAIFFKELTSEQRDTPIRSLQTAAAKARKADTRKPVGKDLSEVILTAVLQKTDNIAEGLTVGLDYCAQMRIVVSLDSIAAAARTVQAKYPAGSKERLTCSRTVQALTQRLGQLPVETPVYTLIAAVFAAVFAAQQAISFRAEGQGRQFIEAYQQLIAQMQSLVTSGSQHDDLDATLTSMEAIPAYLCDATAATASTPSRSRRRRETQLVTETAPSTPIETLTINQRQEGFKSIVATMCAADTDGTNNRFLTTLNRELCTVGSTWFTRPEPAAPLTETLTSLPPAPLDPILRARDLDTRQTGRLGDSEAEDRIPVYDGYDTDDGHKEGQNGSSSDDDRRKDSSSSSDDEGSTITKGKGKKPPTLRGGKLSLSDARNTATGLNSDFPVISQFSGQGSASQWPPVSSMYGEVTRFPGQNSASSSTSSIHSTNDSRPTLGSSQEQTGTSPKFPAFTPGAGALYSQGGLPGNLGNPSLLPTSQSLGPMPSQPLPGVHGQPGLTLLSPTSPIRSSTNATSTTATNSTGLTTFTLSQKQLDILPDVDDTHSILLSSSSAATLPLTARRTEQSGSPVLDGASLSLTAQSLGDKVQTSDDSSSSSSDSGSADSDPENSVSKKEDNEDTAQVRHNDGELSEQEAPVPLDDEVDSSSSHSPTVGGTTRENSTTNLGAGERPSLPLTSPPPKPPLHLLGDSRQPTSTKTSSLFGPLDSDISLESLMNTATTTSTASQLSSSTAATPSHLPKPDATSTGQLTGDASRFDPNSPLPIVEELPKDSLSTTDSHSQGKSNSSKRASLFSSFSDDEQGDGHKTPTTGSPSRTSVFRGSSSQSPALFTTPVTKGPNTGAASQLDTPPEPTQSTTKSRQPSPESKPCTSSPAVQLVFGSPPKEQSTILSSTDNSGSADLDNWFGKSFN